MQLGVASLAMIISALPHNADPLLAVEVLSLQRDRDLYKVDFRVSAKNGTFDVKVSQIEFWAIDPRGGFPRRVLFKLSKSSLNSIFKIAAPMSVRRKVVFLGPHQLSANIALKVTVVGNSPVGTVEGESFGVISVDRAHLRESLSGLRAKVRPVDRPRPKP